MHVRHRPMPDVWSVSHPITDTYLTIAFTKMAISRMFLPPPAFFSADAHVYRILKKRTSPPGRPIFRTLRILQLRPQNPKSPKDPKKRMTQKVEVRSPEREREFIFLWRLRYTYKKFAGKMYKKQIVITSERL